MRRDSGFALIMVIVVALALMAIAIPFAVSMRAQERGARGTVDRTQARYSALAARNHALAAAVRGHENTEEARLAPSPFNTPYSDTVEEFSVAWDASDQGEQQEGGSRTLRGAMLQDEQSKVNERTAPQAVIDRIKSKVDPRTSDMREFLTQYSGRPGLWCAPQTVRAILPSTAGDGSAAIQVFVDDPNAYGEGAKVRLTFSGQPSYGVVDAIDEQGNGIVIKGSTDDDSQVGAVLELEARHPININTASPVVLAACLEGLALRNKITEDTVSAAEAEALAVLILKKKFTTYDDFAKFLEEQASGGTISGNDQLAILTNWYNPNARRLAGTGTVPFQLHSCDYYSVFAHGVQDMPSGSVSAQVDIRDIVEMAPAGVLRWRVRSQYDLEKNLRIPLGNRVVTWPACVANRESPSMDRAQPAWVTTQTGRDERAGWKIMNHWDNSLLGLSTGRGAYVQRAGQILQITNGNVDIEAGAAELWIKTTSTSFTIFDAGPEEWSNRIWFSYGFSSLHGGNVLRLVLKDSSLERTYAEVVHQVTLQPDTWYHLGAFWKGTKYGHAMMTLDGMPVGRFGVMTDTGGIRHVQLSSAISASDTTVVATGSLAAFPATGCIEIGNEAIEYAAVSGSTFTQCVRGARGTSAAAHQAGAGLTIFGYSSKLVNGTLTFNVPGVPPMTWDRLTVGGGATTGFIAADAQSTVGATPPPNPPAGVPALAFAQAANQLTIPSADLSKFPDRGWLTVGAEIVHYDGKNATMFTGVTRGLFGTTDVNHFEWEPVRLWGFHVTSNANYLSPTVLSIDDEWFGPMIKEGADGWRGVTANLGGVTIPIPLFRGARNLFGTAAADHAAGALVLPTFALADQQAGAGDPVTFVEQDPATRVQHTIQHVRWVPNLALATATPQFLLASLDVNVAKEWIADNLWVRVLRFPSGELMGINHNQITFAGTSLPNAPAGFNGNMDELRLTNGPKNLTFQMSGSVDASTTTIPILDVSGMDAEGGAILVGDELIGYSGVDAAANTLVNCTRGYLGSTAAVHELGDRVFNMAFMAIAALTSPVAAADKLLPVNPNGFQQEGFAMVGQEIVGYTGLNGGLSMPDGCDFRGAFGTTPAGHNTGDLVYNMPFRYYDRYTVNSDDSQTAWLGASHRATGARWRRLLFEETLPNNSVDIHVYARFNAEPRWTTPPAGRPGSTWLFTGPAGGGLALARGDQIDVRVVFLWLDGAYGRGEWKDSPRFHGLTVEYEQEPVVHMHEEK